LGFDGIAHSAFCSGFGEGTLLRISFQSFKKALTSFLSSTGTPSRSRAAWPIKRAQPARRSSQTKPFFIVIVIRTYGQYRLTLYLSSQSSAPSLCERLCTSFSRRHFSIPSRPNRARHGLPLKRPAGLFDIRLGSFEYRTQLFLPKEVQGPAVVQNPVRLQKKANFAPIIKSLAG